MKIETKTKSGVQVQVSIGEAGNVIDNYAAIAEFTIPNRGSQKIEVTWGRVSRDDRREGLRGNVRGLGSVCLQVPKEDVQPIFDEIKRLENEKQKEKYQHLEDQLPPIPEFSNTPDEKKFNEIMSKISNQYFSGPEDDGLNLAVSAGNSRIRSEARQYCNHEIKIEINRTFTQDARRKIERDIYCEKCGLHIHEEVEEELSDSVIWR